MSTIRLQTDAVVLSNHGNGIFVGVGRGLAIVDNHVEATGSPIRIAGNNLGIRVERNWLESELEGADPVLDMPNVCYSCHVLNNQAYGGAGMYFNFMISSQVVGNSIYTTSEFGNGIHCDDCQGVSIQENSIYGYLYGVGILLDGATTGSDDNTIERNRITNFQLGIHMTSTSNRNSYGRNNVPRNLPGGVCPGQVAPACTAPGLCDEGSSNKSFGDNLVPGPPPC